MGTTLATKSDLDQVRGEMRQEFALVRKDMELLSTTMTVRLGSMLVVGFGLTIASLRFIVA